MLNFLYGQFPSKNDKKKPKANNRGIIDFGVGTSVEQTELKKKYTRIFRLGLHWSNGLKLLYSTQ